MSSTPTQTQTHRPPPIYIFSHPRTRSNLLARLLETHPQIGDAILYPHRAAHVKGPERRVKDGSLFAVRPEEIEVSGVYTFQYCFDEMWRGFEGAYGKGLIPVVKEHVHMTMYASVVDACVPGVLEVPDPDSEPVVVDKLKTSPTTTNTTSPNPNPMILPASFLASITPILMIRHPIRTVTSGMGIMLGTYGKNIDEPAVPLTCTLKWTRILFNYYQSSAREAIVIDGDELVRDTKGQMDKLCALLGPGAGVDGSGIRYEWKAKKESVEVSEEMREEVYLRDLYESTGVIVNEEKLKPPNLDEETKMWAEKWGVDVANKLREYTEEALEDYNYLLQYRL
ncbi:hypothetical protein V5O48_018356 [Marasmius crinis-equi]|uniref:Uncharacterized protein n=1 Tax=Marasmius crinis-equi TaxID=585013 RepID=A0ABR3ELF1_9AGAR